MRIANFVLRAVPGAFVLNSGLGKLKLDHDSAKYLQDAASKGIPAVKDMTPEQFGKFLSFGEIAVGSALLLPFVPTRVAGLALGSLATGLVAAYFRTPEMTEADGVRPTEQGMPVSKDTWLAAIAIALILGGAKKD
ncbi:hypothetical protein [Brachybacterium huguangmaarense]